MVIQLTKLAELFCGLQLLGLTSVVVQIDLYSFIYNKAYSSAWLLSICVVCCAFFIQEKLIWNNPGSILEQRKYQFFVPELYFQGEAAEGRRENNSRLGL